MESFPSSFVAEFRGLARKSRPYEIDGNTGVSAERYLFERENADGELVQVELRIDHIDQVAGFDATKLKRGDWVEVHGEVRPGYNAGTLNFRPQVFAKTTAGAQVGQALSAAA